MPRKVKAKGAGLMENIGDYIGNIEAVKGAGLKKTTSGRKTKELVAHEVLLKELAKVKTPVKTQRRANKKQDALDIRDFVSKSKPKDQVTQLTNKLNSTSTSILGGLTNLKKRINILTGGAGFNKLN